MYEKLEKYTKNCLILYRIYAIVSSLKIIIVPF